MTQNDDYVPIKNMAAWLAYYTDPPEHALKVVSYGKKEITEEVKAEAWRYQIQKLKDYGLMEG